MIPATEQQEFTNRGRRFLRWTRSFFFVAGALAVSYVALTLLHGKLYQQAANHALEQQVHAEEQHTVSLPGAGAKEGDMLGRLEIPRLGLSVAVLQGTT